MAKQNDKSGLLTKLQNAITAQLMDLFDLVITERKEFYAENPNFKITPAQINKIIGQYANSNAAISGGMSLVPGLAGLATVVPEIVLVVRNQLQLVCDIANAHQKSKLLTKELLAGILLSYFGSKGIEMLTIQGSQVLLSSVSVKFFEQAISLLSIQISQQIIQSAIVKWVPLAGSVAMAMWSRYTTMKIGAYAESVLSKDIKNSNKEAAIKEVATPAPSPAELELAKIKVLINLMHMDLSNDSREVKFVEQIISNSSLETAEQLDLAKKIHDKTEVAVDVQLFKQSPTAAMGLLVDMLALAKSDADTPLAEMLYLRNIAQTMGVSKTELEALLA